MNPNIERERIRAALRGQPIPRLASQLGVDVAVLELFVTTNAHITAELQASLAAIVASAERANVRAPVPVPEKRKNMPTLNARTLKCVLVLDAKELAAFPRPADSVQRIVFQIRVAGGRNIDADIAAKSIRKCKKVIEENGADNVALILQGKLTDGSVVHEAGLIAQVKVQASDKEKENAT